ncbi:histone-lysine N-methyltransferase SETMAR isoform X3 [Gopherus evgoodei]|uniref:histone-lysine N-methyltransferase SETMAR isoform X3 n=1 Tax=Gopherus evgoodei TaxID=1825980 RepID=UPI0011CEE68D|nr:histone-lysine N-methyltransferase SETMAR isoform X3 [Gopherus evgoodei]
MSRGSQSEWREVGFVAMATVARPRPRLAVGSMDLSRGLESLPVSVWPPSEELPAFQYSPEHVAGAGEDTDPSEITFPGCNCLTASCVTNTCSCLRHGENYNNSCIKYIGSEVDYTRPIFECNAMCRCANKTQFPDLMGQRFFIHEEDLEVKGEASMERRQKAEYLPIKTRSV